MDGTNSSLLTVHGLQIHCINANRLGGSHQLVPQDVAAALAHLEANHGVQALPAGVVDGFSGSRVGLVRV